ncbi:peptide/nickel transport system permease protein [Methylobacterium pseudosasicola]|uniref:Peptide/nickel transport system permease protein n=2 Tax=Methylobacterium pseudosasicola TaxID=582667 RepID=A0A1I4UM14_9HYPH|nr:peptide/nickel transport system permease protein [Methylobacterium pseudosasicola]
MLAGYSAPMFWLELVGLAVFYSWLGWVGGPGRLDVAYRYSVEARTGLVLVDTLLGGSLDAFRDAVSHLVLPASLLGFHTAAYLCG